MCYRFYHYTRDEPHLDCSDCSIYASCHSAYCRWSSQESQIIRYRSCKGDHQGRWGERSLERDWTCSYPCYQPCHPGEFPLIHCTALEKLKSCQYTTFERLVALLLSYRLSRSGGTGVGKHAGTGRSSLSDWDMFMLGAVSKLVATGGTYPYVSLVYTL